MRIDNNIQLNRYITTQETGSDNNKISDSGSIFNNSKTDKTTKKDKTLNEQEVMFKIGNEQVKLAKEYSAGKSYQKTENIEKALKNSKVPGLSGVPTFAKSQIKSISDEINTLVESITTKCSNCKTEADIKNVIKEVESELMQKKHTANVLVQRTIKAQELDKALSKIYSDPQKAKLAEKIDISKIIDKLTGPVEEVNIDDIKGQDNIDDKSKDNAIAEKFDEALKNDEISNVVDSLIKYLNNGEKDNKLNDYMKDEPDSKDKKAFST